MLYVSNMQNLIPSSFYTLSSFVCVVLFSLMKKVPKKSRENYTSTRSADLQEFLQKMVNHFCEILSKPAFTLTPARNFLIPPRFCRFAASGQIGNNKQPHLLPLPIYLL